MFLVFFVVSAALFVLILLVGLVVGPTVATNQKDPAHAEPTALTPEVKQDPAPQAKITEPPPILAGGTHAVLIDDCIGAESLEALDAADEFREAKDIEGLRELDMKDKIMVISRGEHALVITQGPWAWSGDFKTEIRYNHRLWWVHFYCLAEAH